MIIEWSAIDEELYAEAGETDIVQVDSNDPEYMPRMEQQNKKVYDYLIKKYPDRQFRISEWHKHDFGDYQEVEERFEYAEDDIL